VLAKPMLFRTLADELEAMILRGEYRVGDRLPSVRVLHLERSMAVGTVLLALYELEARGLVEARPRSGYFVVPRTQVAVPTTPHRSLRPRLVPLPHVADTFVSATADATVVPFGGTVLASETLPIKHLQRLTKEVMSDDPTVFSSYGPPSGDVDLRRQVARQLVTVGVRASAEDIVITSGAMNAMRLAIGVITRPGDAVAVESPTFFALLPMLRDAGLLVVEVATDPTTGINVEALGSIAARRNLAAVIVTPNFHNPTGSCMSTENKRALLAVTRRHGICVIEDDVYGDLYFGARRPRPLASLATADDQVFYCSSFSKTLSAGLRIGFVVSGKQRDAIVRAKLSSTISSPVLNQRVIARFLASGAYGRHLRRLRDALRRQVTSATQSIVRNFPTGVAVTAPTGGFVLWVRLPHQGDGLALYQRAIHAGIAILPGHVCAIDDRYRDHIRISCGHPWSPRFDDAMRLLGQMVEG
jgi:DNA-binding transcriptional MocR family regulator